jgi:hypothetical protein
VRILRLVKNHAGEAGVGRPAEEGMDGDRLLGAFGERLPGGVGDAGGEAGGDV